MLAEQTETFWTLFRSVGHWEFELFLMVLFDGLIFWFLWGKLVKPHIHRDIEHSDHDHALHGPHEGGRTPMAEYDKELYVGQAATLRLDAKEAAKEDPFDPAYEPEADGTDLTLNEYQEGAATTALGLAKGEGDSPLGGAVYCALGLNGEAGEVAERVKKSWRNVGSIDEEAARKIAYELGDTLWYLASTASSIGYNLGDIAEMNLEKLADRKQRSVVASEGDTR